MLSPLEQFSITPLLYLFSFFEVFGIYLTNFTLFALVLVGLLSCVSFICITQGKVLPSARQYIIEVLFDFVFNMLQANLKKEHQKYFPVFFLFFSFILFVNLFGLFPYGFTLSSQVIFACTLAFTAFIGLVIIGIKNYKINFFALFFPSDAPLFLAALLVPIEIVSFFSRPFSLAIRLFANMTAGHVLLKILAGFAVFVFSVLFGLVIDLKIILDFLGLGNNQQFFVSFAGSTPVTYSLVKLDCFKFCCCGISLISLNDMLGFFYTGSSCDEFISSNSEYFNYFFNQNFILSDYVSFYLYSIDESKKVFEFPFYGLYEQSQYLFYSIAEKKSFFLSVNLAPIISFFSGLVNISFILFVILFLLFIIILFVILELFVAILQAYVFSILLIIYLRDVHELH